VRIFLTTVLLLIFGELVAQDTHYWTQQFGTRSSLMGGAVVGRVMDNSSIFYNPACLALVDTSSVSINADLYQLEKTRIENALGNQKDFNHDNFKNLPLLFSGIISTHNPGLKIGYGFASSVDYNFKGIARIDSNSPVVDDAESPGNETYIGQLSLSSRISETTFGLGIGKKLNEHWSIGTTLLSSWRSQNYQRSLFTRMFLNKPGNPLVSSDHIESFSYNNLRSQVKLGVHYRGNRYDIGMSVNTPSFKILGKGIVAADITANNILYQGQRIDVLANDRQEKLPSIFKTPWSIAGGINLDMKRGQLGVTVQYFGSKKIYDILHAKPAAFIRPPQAYPDIGSDDFLRVKTGNKSVVNWTVGYEYNINNKYTFDISFRADNSYFDKAVHDLRGIKPDISSWDIYHVVVGGNASARRLSLSAGFLFGFGSNKNYIEEGNLEEPQERNLLQGKYSYHKSRLSFFWHFTWIYYSIQ
jgi:hypothetical protein